MRRTLAGSAAFLAMTGTFVILPVYASPAPEAQPVEPAIEEVALGSVSQPEGDAVVTTDGEPLATVPSTEAPVPGATPTEVPAPSAPAEPGADDDIASSGQELPGVPALTVSQPDTEEFSSVGITWRQTGVADVVVQLRVKDADGEWGDWTILEADDVEQTESEGTPSEDVRGGTAPYWTGEAYGVEVIVQRVGGLTPEDVRVALIDPGESPADALSQASAVADQAHATAGMPAVYSRAQWGADETLRTWDPEYAPTIEAATVHHTADGNGYSAEDVPGIMRSIYAYHTVTRGWGDIGYNVIVDRFGRLFEGRYGGLASTVIGAHAGGFNTSTFGVSMLGNYESVAVPQATVNAVADIIAWKLSLYRVHPRGTTVLTSAGGGTAKYEAGTAVTLPTIFGHRDVGSTACPGKYGYGRLNEIRDRALLRTSYYDQFRLDKTNADTGYITDVSPMGVSSVTTPGGTTTVFARGADNAIWYRSTRDGVAYTAWAPIPGAVASSAPASVSVDSSSLFVVVRGRDKSVLMNSATVDGAGLPRAWGSWVSLGGTTTTAPGIASTGPNQLAVVARGGDGAVWHRLHGASGWSPWASLGGRTYSAPAIEVDQVGGTWRYVTTAVGADWSLWRVPSSATLPAVVEPWSGGEILSTHGPATANASSWNWSPKAMSTGTVGHGVVLVDAGGTWNYELGGTVTSVAAVARQPDGAVIVYARGSDGGLWSIRYRYPSDVGTWTNLGGRIT